MKGNITVKDEVVGFLVEYCNTLYSKLIFSIDLTAPVYIRLSMYIWKSLCFVSSSSSSTRAFCLYLYFLLKALHRAASLWYPLFAFWVKEELDLFSDGREGEISSFIRVCGFWSWLS